MKTMKYRANKIFKFKIILLIFFIINLVPIISKASIEDFPNSYKPYLYELQKKHPSWTFTPLNTNLDWKYVIDNENIFGKNLVPKSYSDNWKNTKPGEYNVEVDAGWVDCSRQALLYTMDPRNFLNEVRIFQFEELSFNEKINSIDSIEKILYGTEFYNNIVSYLTSSGQNITTDKKYSDLIYLAGKTSKVSTNHLASRIKQEVGPFLSHSSISGKVAGYEGLYNFYNIGATSSSEPMGAIINGLKYARDGKGASEETKAKFLIPWNTKERAITGGGIFIGSSYINKGQNNIYLQKFHVNDAIGGELFWHQYMTNVLAPYSESQSIYKGYNNSNLLNSAMNFIIPVYNNMEKIQPESPNINKSDFESDNTKVYANVETTLNVRTGPSTSYESITLINKNEKMTRIAKGKQAGDRWDRVILENGIVGYVFQNYIEELPETQIQEIQLSIDNNVINKNETKKINVKIIPEEASNHKVEYSSNNEKVLKVSQDGSIYGVSSGKATVTVKAIDNDVKASIDIEVYSKVTDIQLNVEKITLQQGSTYKIIANVLPDDANNKNINYSSENNALAKVDNTGNITAINIGKTNINITSQENSEITKQIEVNVIEKINDGDILFGDELKVEGNEITGITQDLRKVEQLKNKIQVSENYKIKILNREGKELQDNELVGTGAKVQIIRIQNTSRNSQNSDNEIIGNDKEKENINIVNKEESKSETKNEINKSEEIIQEYTIIIYGDINGDGKINSTDLLKLQRHILEIEQLDIYSQKAGNIAKNGKKPTSLDLLLIQRDVLGLQKITQ